METRLNQNNRIMNQAKIRKNSSGISSVARKVNDQKIPYFLVILVIIISLLTGVFYTPIKRPDCEISESKAKTENQYKNFIYGFSLTIPYQIRLEKGKCEVYPLISGYYTHQNADIKLEIGVAKKQQGVSLIDQIQRGHDSKTMIIKQEMVQVSQLDALHEIGSLLGSFEAFHIQNGNNIITIVRYFMEYSPDPVFDSIVQSFKVI